MKIFDSGVQFQEFLRSFPPLESLLLSLLTSCGTLRLFDDIVTPGRGDHLLVIDIDQTQELSDGHPVTPQLIGVNDLWDVILTQEPSQEGLRSFSVSVSLEENIEHETVLVHSPPKPVSDAIDARTHLIHMPPGAPPGFPVTQFFHKQRSELDTPFAKGLVAHLNAVLVQQFLNIALAQEKPVVEPKGVLDNAQRKTVSVGLAVSHRGSATANRG